MALYSFESPASIIRVSGQNLVPDTSYLISLIDPTRGNHSIVDAFHQATQPVTSLFINVIIRHELIRYLRNGLLIKAITDMHTANPSIEARFRAAWNAKPRRSLSDFIAVNAECILKDYIKANDYGDILARIPDVWADFIKAEQDLSLIYMSGSSSDSWDLLGKLINKFCMEPTDSMILNFANFIEADAIVTNDIGFAVASTDIDVYMPRGLASQCVGLYNPAIDI